MERILVPIDFSENSEIAYKYAIMLANRLSAELYVLHVYEPPNIKSGSLPTTLKEVYKDIENEEIAKFEGQIPRLNNIDEELGVTGVKKINLLKQGEFKKVVRHIIEKENIAIVIMGTQGHTAVDSFFLGSNSAYLLDHSPVPVLVIPPAMHPSKRLSEFTFMTDFSDDAYNAMKWLISISEDMSINTSAIHVSSSPDTNEEQKWKDTFSQNSTYFHVEDSDLVVGLNSFLSRHPKIDAVAIVTHELNFFQSLFKRGKAKQILHTKSTPVLGIPDSFVKDI